MSPLEFTNRNPRPPFPPGNELSLVHGARSPRKVEPLASDFVGVAVGHLPMLSDPSYEPALQRWAVAEAKCLLYERWLDEHGYIDDEGRERDAAKGLRAWQSRASKEADALGLTPRSRAEIGKNLMAIRRASLYEPEQRRSDET